jgi:hypothetical protein
MKLVEIYERCSDDEIREMIQEGKDSFEEGAYDLIRIEARKRRIDIKPDNKAGKKMNFDEMSNEDLLGVLVNIHTLDELSFHLASAEAIKRNIDAADIRAFKKIVNCEQCGDGIEIEMIENPRPLIILKTIDEARLYIDTLDEEEIPFEIQIIVDDRDYKKAEMATGNILPFPEDE